MTERDQVSTFDCDHHPQGSQPDTVRSMEEFEKRYFPEDVKKYPVVFRRRVTQEESDAIDEWIRNRRVRSYVEEDRNNE